MKRNLLLIALVFSLSVNLAVFFTVAHNWWSRRETQFRDRAFLPNDFREKLTARQLEEIRNLRRLSLAKAKKLKEVLGERRELLIEELTGAEPNREKIDEILRDIGRTQFELEKEVIDNLLRIGELLPPKQRERILSTIREKLRERGRWRAPRYPIAPEKFKGR